MFCKFFVPAAKKVNLWFVSSL